MSRRPPERSTEADRFRLRLVATMMVVLAGVTAVALYLTRRSLAEDERRHLSREFESAIAILHQVRGARHSAMIERCRALAQKARIHAALEDDALDLLYLAAGDELRDVLAAGPSARSALQARFYRFLDRDGNVILPAPTDRAGDANARCEELLRVAQLPTEPQLGYVPGVTEAELVEILATPIVSTVTQDPIGALVLGFSPVALDGARLPRDVSSGILSQGRLFGFSAALTADLREVVQHRISGTATTEGSFEHVVAGEPCLIFYQQLNSGSTYPAAYEVGVFPLTDMKARQRRVGWQIVGAGCGLMLGGFVVSHLAAKRLADPVDRLAHESEEQRLRGERAETALQSTSAELARAARFSADASHQLKTPVTVLRAGLEELLAAAHRTPAELNELSALIHQTYRLSSIIEDLLLLSRIDAGQLRIRFDAVDVSELMEGAIDDLSALPDEFGIDVVRDFPAGLRVAGERRFIALILQNLLENARKYNRPRGTIRLRAGERAGEVTLSIANTSLHPISPETQAHIFERFHRGVVGENIAGYGLGLNLARELARLHEGDVWLERSDEQWTEMCVRLRAFREVGAAEETRS